MQMHVVFSCIYKRKTRFDAFYEENVSALPVQKSLPYVGGCQGVAMWLLRSFLLLFLVFSMLFLRILEST